MKKLSIFGFFCFLLAQAILPRSLQAQNWTTVTAINITDLNQQKLAAGQLCFLATDQTDNPISIGIGGGGQLLRRAFCAAVANGAVTGFSVPNPAATAPAGVMYRVTVNDTSVGKEVLRYTQVGFTGATFNFDAYAPTGAGPLVPLGNTVNGNLNVNGNTAITGTITASNIPGGQFDTGTGTNNTLPKFTNGLSGVIGNSSMSDNGITVSMSEPFSGVVTVQSAGNLQDLVVQATGAANEGIGIKNSTQTWAIGVRSDLSQAFNVRNLTGSSDALLIDTSGNATYSGNVAAVGNITLAEAAAPTGAASKDILYADSTAHRLKANSNNGGASTVALSSDNLSFFTSTTSAQLASVISDETGSGGLVFAASPSLTTPTIGSAGANFSGSTSGSTTLKASATASGTLTLPVATDTVAVLGTAQTWGAVNQTNMQLVTPKIGGTTISNVPVMTWTIDNANGTINVTSGAFSQFTPISGITVKRIEVVVAGSAAAGCTTSPIVRVTDGTTNLDTAITNGTGIFSTNFAQNYSAGAVIQMKTVAGAGCTTSPTNPFITVQYTMQ